MSGCENHPTREKATRIREWPLRELPLYCCESCSVVESIHAWVTSSLPKCYSLPKWTLLTTWTMERVKGGYTHLVTWHPCKKQKIWFPDGTPWHTTHWLVNSLTERPTFCNNTVGFPVKECRQFSQACDLSLPFFNIIFCKPNVSMFK